MQATGVLHTTLLQQIDQISWPSRITRDKAIAFLHGLTKKRHMENTTPMEYTDMAAVYLRQKLTTQYRKITKPLLDNGIIQSTGHYYKGFYTEEGKYIKGQCLSYRINPELMDDEVIKVVYEREKKHQKCRDEVTMKSKQILRQLRIPDMNSRELITFVKRSLTDERIRKMLKVNSPVNSGINIDDITQEITDRTIHIKGSPYPVPIEKIKLRTKSLIKDGKYCHIEHLDVYIKRKRRHLVQSYCDQLLRIKHRNVYADRNDTNLRLDSNLTNLKSDFMSLLSIDDQRLSQIDLKNSQFRFFVMLLEQCERQIIFRGDKPSISFEDFSAKKAADTDFKVRLKGGKEAEGQPVTLLLLLFDQYCTIKQGLTTSLTADYKRFRKLVKTGQLYEYIQRIWFAEKGEELSRSEAKKLMFTIAFSSYMYNPEGKVILKKYLPSVVSVIDGFKREAIRFYAEERGKTKEERLDGAEIESKGNYLSQEVRDKGNAAFAVMLQQVESVVFVDKILADCHDRGLKVLSKHDSIVCRQCDKRMVTALILRTLNKIFGKNTYILDIDGEVWELRKKRKSRLGRAADGVVMTLFGVSGLANGPPELVNSNQSIVNRRQLAVSGDVLSSEESAVDSPQSSTTLLYDRSLREKRSLEGVVCRSHRVEMLRRKIMGLRKS